MERRLHSNECLFAAILIVLLAYVSLVPFYYFNPVGLTTGFPQLKLSKYAPFALSLLLAAVGAHPIRSGRIKLRFGFLEIAVGLYFLVSLLSLINAEFPKIGFGKWMYYHATGAVICLILAQVLRSAGIIWRIGHALAVLGMIVAVYTVLFSVLGEDYIWGETHKQFNPYYSIARPAGPFGNPVSTATYLVFLIPLMLWSGKHSRHVATKVGMMCGAILAAFATLLTQGRAASICLLVALSIGFGLMRGWWGVRIKTRHILGSTVFLIVVAAGLSTASETWNKALKNELGEVRERWRHLLSTEAVSIRYGDKTYDYDSLFEYTERFRIAQFYTTINMLRDYPLLGVGFGNFSRVFPKYKHTDNYEEWEFSIHTTDNMYLMMLAETGVLGLTTGLAAVWGVVVLTFLAHRTNAHGKQRDVQLAFLGGGTAMIITMGAWDLLNDPTIRIVFWVVAGLAIATVRLGNVDGSNTV